MKNTETKFFKEIIDYFKMAFEELSFDLTNEKLQCIDNSEIFIKKNSNKNVSILIGITGSYSGRLVFSANSETVDEFTKKMTSEVAFDSEEEKDLYFAEFANMVCGKALSTVNNTNRNVKLWFSPPAVLSGAKMDIVNIGLHSEKIHYLGNLGEIIVNIALKDGEE